MSFPSATGTYFQSYELLAKGIHCQVFITAVLGFHRFGAPLGSRKALPKLHPHRLASSPQGLCRAGAKRGGRRQRTALPLPSLEPKRRLNKAFYVPGWLSCAKQRHQDPAPLSTPSPTPPIAPLPKSSLTRRRTTASRTYPYPSEA